MDKDVSEDETMQTTTEAQQAASMLYTVDEVATLLRVNGATVRRWIRSGAIEAVCLPRTGKRQTYRVAGDTVNSLLRGDIRPV